MHDRKETAHLCICPYIPRYISVSILNMTQPVSDLLDYHIVYCKKCIEYMTFYPVYMSKYTFVQKKYVIKLVNMDKSGGENIDIIE